jgi:hypothetical protein
MKRTLSIDLIRTDGGTQPRAEVNLFTVADYSASMLEGAVFPPVTVFFDGSDYWLGDGFHRLAARSEAGFLDIQADVRKGTQSDAQWFSLSANRTHGLRRTNEDKRRAIVAALSHPNGKKLSDRQLAEHCGVGHAFVAKIRSELSVHGGQKTNRLVTRGGTTYEQNTANIGKSVTSRVMESLHNQGLISDMPPQEPVDPDSPLEPGAESIVTAPPSDSSWPRVRRGARFSDAIRILAEVDDVEDYAAGLWEIDPLGTPFREPPAVGSRKFAKARTWRGE